VPLPDPRSTRNLLSALALGAATGCATVHARPHGANAAMFEQLERDIGDANIRRDKAFFQRIEADECLFTGSDGSLTTKSEDVASVDQPPAATLTTYAPDSMRVEIYGLTAVVWGRITTGGHRRDGSAFQHRSRFTDVFVYRDGRWQLVSGQSSTLPDDTPRTPA